MGEPELIDTVPVVAVSDLERSLTYYGSSSVFEMLFNIGFYAGIRRGEMMMHLDAGDHEFASRPISLRFHVRGADDLYAEVEPSGVVKPDETLTEVPHHFRQFSVLDPDRNRITFAEPVE